MKLESRFPTLNLMLSDMPDVPELYRPTHWWEGLVPTVLDQLEKDGVEKIKYQDNFVPIYCSGAYRRHPRLFRFIMNVLRVTIPDGRVLKTGLRNHLLGYPDAFSDYKLFKAVDEENRCPILTDVSESSFGGGAEIPGFIFEFDGKPYSKGLLKYLKLMAFLKRSVDTSSVTSVLEIGGGHGPLGEIMLKAKGNDFFYVDVDIPPMSFIAFEYLKGVFGADQILGYEKTREMSVIDLDQIRNDYRAMVICPWQLPKVTGNIDLIVNSSSFQEMEPRVVQNYANLVTPLTTQYALIHNRVFGQRTVVEEVDTGRGVEDPMSVEDIIGYFSDFTVVARDRGGVSNKHHELVVLARNK